MGPLKSCTARLVRDAGRAQSGCRGILNCLVLDAVLLDGPADYPHRPHNVLKPDLLLIGCRQTIAETL